MSDLLAIIGGTGLNLRNELSGAREETVRTPWGEARVTLASENGRELVFLHRHTAGSGHHLPPHAVNYRANIAALKSLGVTGIFASFAVGGMRRDWPPGTLALLHDFVDCTHGRGATFFDERSVHADMTEPYCPRLRELLQHAAAELALPLQERAVYLCTQGPRFETPAEIRVYSRWADVVGMTGCPEIALAREANISYAGVAIVTNFAAGLLPQPLTQAEVLEAMGQALPRVRELFLHAARGYRDDPQVASRRVTEEYGTPDILG